MCVTLGNRDVAEVQWFWTQDEIADAVLKRCSKTFGPVQSNEVFLNVGKNVQREIDPETVLCKCIVSFENCIITFPAMKYNIEKHELFRETR